MLEREVSVLERGACVRERGVSIISGDIGVGVSERFR